MNNRFIALLVLMLTFSVSFGQKIQETAGFKNVIEITPLKLFQPVNNAIEISYDRNHNTRFTTTISASYLFTNWLFIALNDFNPNIKGFRTSFQERYYFALPNGNESRKYVALELDYLNNSYQTQGKFARNGSPTPNFNHYSDTFGVKKQFIALSAKIGFQKTIKRFTIDGYIGIGLRMKYCSYQNRLYPDDKYYFNPKGGGPPSYNSEVEGWTPNASLPMNIRIGYAF